MKKKILITVGLIILFYAALVVGRVIGLIRIDATKSAVAKIHATHITMDDVMGKNLPPDPGSEADKTLAGVDANHNGIRDDVELAIFKAYPHSARTRAVLLQYAQALQLEFTQPIVNEETVTAVEEQKSRGYLCIGKIFSRSDIQKYLAKSNKLRSFVEAKETNSQNREKFDIDFYKNLASGSVPTADVCDLSLTSLPN